MGDLKYALHIQRDNGRAKAQPEIRQNVYFETHNRICFAWISEGVPASKPLHDCNISLHPNGLSITGVERDGEVYQYQEWWLSPLLPAVETETPLETFAPQPPEVEQEPEVSQVSSPLIEQDTSTLNEVKQAFEAIQAEKNASERLEEDSSFTDINSEPEAELEIGNYSENEFSSDTGAEAEFEAELEETALEQAEELEIMEELGLSPDDEDESNDSFDNLAVLSDSELNSLADEPAVEGDEADDMASIEGIENVLDDAINEVLGDQTSEHEAPSSDAFLQEEPFDEDPIFQAGGVEAAMNQVLQAANNHVSTEDGDDMMLGEEIDFDLEENSSEEIPEDASIISTDEINAMLGDDVPPEDEDKEI